MELNINEFYNLMNYGIKIALDDVMAAIDASDLDYDECDKIRKIIEDYKNKLLTYV